jgi:radical SAM superfamily enzyme YgiQ (UPF0313 family)
MICEPIELEYVAAGLDGHEVQIMDLILERGLERRLRRFKPDVVGTSSYINGVNEVKKICRAVKQWNPNCKTIVGGVHASVVPEDFADADIDCIVLGDGTTAIGPLVEAFKSNRPISGIPGLALFRNGGLEKTADREFYMPAPDSLPMPRRDLVAHLQSRYYYLFHQPVALMKTTWGCWYRCNFCFPWKITGGIPFSRSPESIADELETIACNDVYIVDDIFLINRKRLDRLAAILHERGIRKKYLVFARADFISENEEVIEQWAELGLHAVLIGLEASTNQELESMNKESSVDCNVRAVRILQKHGVDPYGSLIPHPDYLPADWERLQRFIDDNDLYYLNISPLTPLPGTEIWPDYEESVIVPREAHGLWDLSHTVLPTRMPLKDFYRSLMRVYARTVLNMRRAHRITLRTRPPVWSWRYLRLWLGAGKILFQFLRIHRHHQESHLRRAANSGQHDHPRSNKARVPWVSAFRKMAEDRPVAR